MGGYFTDLLWSILVLGVLYAGYVTDGVAGAAALLFVLVLYFLPYIIAGFRGHRNLQAIAVLNLFLGWTFVGWVAILAWSLIAKKDVQAQCKGE